jgi:glucose-1-phosphate thymidylyltransferase
VCYTAQSHPAGLCDAVFRALPLIGPSEPVLIGLPDTIWFPEDGLCALDDGALSFLLCREAIRISNGDDRTLKSSYSATRA